MVSSLLVYLLLILVGLDFSIRYSYWCYMTQYYAIYYVPFNFHYKQMICDDASLMLCTNNKHWPHWFGQQHYYPMCEVWKSLCVCVCVSLFFSLFPFFFSIPFRLYLHTSISSLLFTLKTNDGNHKKRNMEYGQCMPIYVTTIAQCKYTNISHMSIWDLLLAKKQSGLFLSHSDLSLLNVGHE